MSGLLDRVAGAPITWGVCEVPGWGHQLAADRVLAEMAGLGLRATELGPVGFLPTDPAELRERLDEFALALVGGFLPVVLHLAEGLDERLEEAAAHADLLAAAGAGTLVLAASAPADGYEVSPELDGAQWATLVRAIDRVIEIAGERGLRVGVHPHYGTVIERSAHVRRLLETSPVSLCLDTGHLLVGGTDPMEIAAAAPDRIVHTHMKDVDAAWAERVRSGECGYAEAVAAGMYRPLGAGDLDIEGIVRRLVGAGYEGWFVLEQDTVLTSPPPEGAGPVLDAAASVAFLRRVAAGVEAEHRQEVPVGPIGRAAGGARAASDGREEGE